MLPIKKILCPTDFSDPSYVALKSAVELARHFQAEILVLHVVPAVPIPAGPNYVFTAVDEYEAALKEDAEHRVRTVLEQHLPPDLEARALVERGDAAMEIVRTADADRTDMIVIATHGLTGWRHLVFGSVAEKVVRLAGCPVLTVRMPRR